VHRLQKGRIRFSYHISKRLLILIILLAPVVYHGYSQA
jgi:hypothetical protein